MLPECQSIDPSESAGHERRSRDRHGLLHGHNAVPTAQPGGPRGGRATAARSPVAKDHAHKIAGPTTAQEVRPCWRFPRWWWRPQVPNVDTARGPGPGRCPAVQAVLYETLRHHPTLSQAKFRAHRVDPNTFRTVCRRLLYIALPPAHDESERKGFEGMLEEKFFRI